jgi:hypothetical protein
MASMISYAPALIGMEKKSEEPGPTPAERKISRQIDTLQRISRSEFEKKNGGDHVQEMKDFYALANMSSSSATPSYRPKVVLPELQYLLMSESSDLTNDSPKVYISVGGKQDEAREKAFASAWKLALVQNRIFDAVLWSQFVNPSWLQVGYSPDARNGKGMCWVAALDPSTVIADPHATNDRNWAYCGYERWFYIDEVRRMFPEQGWRVKYSGGYEDYDDDVTESQNFELGLELPPGPLRIDSPEGFENQNKGPRVRVRYIWVKDYAKERIEEIAGTKTADGFDLSVVAKKRWKFPGGRFIVECQGINLADGPNFVPKLPEDDFGTFPLVGVWSLPHLDGLYGPPPVRYGKGAQEISEKMYTQLIENMIRTNNAQYWIPKDSGIDIDAFGGIPGEVQVYDGDKPPTMNWANPIPQHMTQIPEVLLQKVARYVGFTPERQGQSGGGNISPELFDASVFQSQSILRMKAKMLAETYQRLTSIFFYMMARMKINEDRLQPSRGKSQQATIWTPLPPDADLDIELDETSVDAMSATMMKTLALQLAKTGMLPQKFVLETLGVPHAAEIADEAQKQMELAALSKLKKPR